MYLEIFQQPDIILKNKKKCGVYLFVFSFTNYKKNIWISQKTVFKHCLHYHGQKGAEQISRIRVYMYSITNALF